MKNAKELITQNCFYHFEGIINNSIEINSTFGDHKSSNLYQTKLVIHLVRWSLQWLSTLASYYFIDDL